MKLNLYEKKMPDINMNNVNIYNKIDELSSSVTEFKKKMTTNMDARISGLHKKFAEYSNKAKVVGTSNKPQFTNIYYSNRINMKMRDFILGNKDNLGKFTESYIDQNDTVFNIRQTDIDQYFLTRIFEKSTLRPIFSVNKVEKGDSMKYYINTNQQMSASWGDTTSTTDFQLTEKIIKIYPLHVSVKLSNEMVLDNMFNLEAWIDQEVISSFVYAEEDAFINGNGTTQPSGIMTESDESNTIGTAKAGSLESDDLMSLYHSLEKKYITENTRFLMNRSTMHQIKTLKYMNGRYIWEPSLYTSEPDKLFGIPVVFSDHITDNPESGTSPFIIFGDFKAAYAVADKLSFNILKDPYTEKPNIILYATRKVGGNTINKEAIKFLSYRLSSPPIIT